MGVGAGEQRVQGSKSEGLGEHMSVWDARESKQKQREGECVGNKKIKVKWRGESQRVCGRERERREEGVEGEGKSKSESGRERESKHEKLRETVAGRTRRWRSEWEREKMRETDGSRL